MARIDAFFKLMNDQKASDLHLVSGQQPVLRIRGDLERIKYKVLDDDELRSMLYEITPEDRIKTFEETGIQDELDAYNPLIPDGHNWKATFMVEYSDENERRDAQAHDMAHRPALRINDLFAQGGKIKRIGHEWQQEQPGLD